MAPVKDKEYKIVMQENPNSMVELGNCLDRIAMHLMERGIKDLNIKISTYIENDHYRLKDYIQIYIDDYFDGYFVELDVGRDLRSEVYKAFYGSEESQAKYFIEAVERRIKDALRNYINEGYRFYHREYDDAE